MVEKVMKARKLKFCDTFCTVRKILELKTSSVFHRISVHTVALFSSIIYQARHRMGRPPYRADPLHAYTSNTLEAIVT